jgi:sulfhydrogenase subunit gamma (sulfur reductase)
MREHTYIPRDAKIIERWDLTPDSVGLRLKFVDNKPFIFRPGQFVMISVLGYGEIPVGITTSPDEKGYIEVAVRGVGMVSHKICALKAGDNVGVNGPLGNGFPMSEIASKDIVIITGGIGLFPLRSLIHHLSLNKKVVKSLTILIGARSQKYLLYLDEYKKWAKEFDLHVIIDEAESGWEGPVGRITKLYDRSGIKRGSIVIVCGPPAMYGSVIDRFAGKSISESDLYFMLERRMKCGIGKCQHCTCGKYYVCLDGPVFSYNRIKYIDEAFL